MATQIALPKLGFSMTEGTITEWLVPDGATVSEGQPLYVLEMDKSAQEIEAPASGTLKILAETGVAHEVGVIIGEIV
jgi:pyruvate/2-oxoglutarate dehydrogenase complex dihydrolipoamide acyltransferase (E2) component